MIRVYTRSIWSLLSQIEILNHFSSSTIRQFSRPTVISPQNRYNYSNIFSLATCKLSLVWLMGGVSQSLLGLGVDAVTSKVWRKGIEAQRQRARGLARCRRHATKALEQSQLALNALSHQQPVKVMTHGVCDVVVACAFLRLVALPHSTLTGADASELHTCRRVYCCNSQHDKISGHERVSLRRQWTAYGVWHAVRCSW